MDFTELALQLSLTPNDAGLGGGGGRKLPLEFRWHVRGTKDPLHAVHSHENSRVLFSQANTLAAEGETFWMVTGSVAVLIFNFPAGQASSLLLCD